MPYQSQESEKEVRQATGFSSAGVTTTRRLTTWQPAMEDQRTPGQRGSSGFQLETADGGGDTPQSRFCVPFSPGLQPGKTGTGTEP